MVHRLLEKKKIKERKGWLRARTPWRQHKERDFFPTSLSTENSTTYLDESVLRSVSAVRVKKRGMIIVHTHYHPASHLQHV
jgi:hypothetical protein